MAIKSLEETPANFVIVFGAAGTCISLVIVGGIIGAYGDSLANNKVAGWVGVAFIYIYDVNFSYSFGRPSFPGTVSLVNGKL